MSPTTPCPWTAHPGRTSSSRQHLRIPLSNRQTLLGYELFISTKGGNIKGWDNYHNEEDEVTTLKGVLEIGSKIDVQAGVDSLAVDPGLKKPSLKNKAHSDIRR